jgi:hypothetical protein
VAGAVAELALKPRLRETFRGSGESHT